LQLRKRGPPTTCSSDTMRLEMRTAARMAAPSDSVPVRQSVTLFTKLQSGQCVRFGFRSRSRQLVALFTEPLGVKWGWERA